MKNMFHSDIVSCFATDKALRQNGELRALTEIKIQGDYLTGPVQVDIAFILKFTPDREYWEANPDDPDERYPHSYEKRFKSTEERSYHQRTFYSLIETHETA